MKMTRQGPPRPEEVSRDVYCLPGFQQRLLSVSDSLSDGSEKELHFTIAPKYFEISAVDGGRQGGTSL